MGGVKPATLGGECSRTARVFPARRTCQSARRDPRPQPRKATSNSCLSRERFSRRYTARTRASASHNMPPRGGNPRSMVSSSLRMATGTSSAATTIPVATASMRTGSPFAMAGRGARQARYTTRQQRAHANPSRRLTGIPLFQRDAKRPPYVPGFPGSTETGHELLSQHSVAEM